ncbi:glycosyl hydrolase family 2 [Kribbella amoyensis]|uniref:Glycosyl hydrolase family 2 n=1 Tax=Kribbella amoyensis TaxID=996641 RepID=A0A561C0X3_9ACTN|nr:sugar-binding domain-containing protein [Kribbella amoyensis]TWD84697.1 glycosyl hydrolase family 2 [Kribbella amoyensis]
MANPDLTHPRPQLVRDGWTDLCGEWRFAFDDDDRGLRERWWTSAEAFDRAITVPYPPESKASGVHETGYHPVLWYRRTFEAAAVEGRRTLLHFGAVDYRAKVWVNGVPVGDHEGGQTPFALDVTDALDPAQPEQVLVVRAEDQPLDVSQPRGKQDWLPEPHAIWYHRTSGIWQPVWTETVAELHVSEVRWTPEIGDARVRMALQLSGVPAGPVTVRVVLRLGEEVLSHQTVQVRDNASEHDIAVPALRNGQYRQRLLWSPESPTLIDAEVTLLDDGTMVDEVSSYLGLRSAEVADGRFLLNGRPYFLRLVLGQGYWPQSHLTAPDDAALKREAELIKELGFNGVRVHQKVEDPRFLSWCDRLGVLVWGEMANAYEYSVPAVERLTREWLDVVRRDVSHPCVVTWVPLNESWGVPDIAERADQQHFATALYHLTKAIDPSRPVISNDGWEHTESDIWGVHDYSPTEAGLRERYGDADAVHRTLHERWPGRHRVLLGDPVNAGQPVVLTEFGGLSYTPSAGEKWFGYGTVESADELRDRLGELIGALLDSPEVAGFCYTQLTDTEQERNGLLTENREPKLPLDVVHEILTRPARAVPTEMVDAQRSRARARIR